MTKHTNGPWEATLDPGGSLWVGAGGHAIAEVLPDAIPGSPNLSDPNAEDQANALLIAAAPDLLDALEHVEALLAQMPGVKTGYIGPKIEAALRKAGSRRYQSQDSE